MAGTPQRWRERGISQRQLRTLVASGDLVQFRRGAYVTRAGVKWAGENPRQRHALVVYVAMGSVSGAVASHESAAVLHGAKLFSDPGDRVTLTVPAGQRRSGKDRHGVTVHAAELPEEHVRGMLGVPLTSAGRTAADLARTLPFMEAVVMADSTLHLDLASKGEIDVVLDQCAGWPGVRRARRVIGFADRNAESPLESCGRVFLREHGIEPPQVQVNVRGDHYSWYADLGWPDRKILVEFDGMAKYRSADEDRNQAALEDQFTRDRVLRDRGYQVIHITWNDLFKTPDVTLDRIRKAFAVANASAF